MCDEEIDARLAGKFMDSIMTGPAKSDDILDMFLAKAGVISMVELGLAAAETPGTGWRAHAPVPATLEFVPEIGPQVIPVTDEPEFGEFTTEDLELFTLVHLMLAPHPGRAGLVLLERTVGLEIV